MSKGSMDRFSRRVSRTRRLSSSGSMSSVSKISSKSRGIVSLLEAHRARRMPARLAEQRERQTGGVIDTVPEATASRGLVQQRSAARRRGIILRRIVILIERWLGVQPDFPGVCRIDADAPLEGKGELSSEVVRVVLGRGWRAGDTEPEAEQRYHSMPGPPARQIEVEAEVGDVQSQVLRPEGARFSRLGGIERVAMRADALEAGVEIRRARHGYGVAQTDAGATL